MADILASVSVQLGMEVSAFKAALADARKDLNGFVQFSEGLQSVGESLSKYVTVPMVAFGTAAVAASAKMESLRKGLEAVAQQELGRQGVTGLAAIQEAASQTGERIQVLQDIAKAPGIGFEQAERGDLRLRGVGISAAESAKDLREFANAVALSGGSAADLDRVTVQLAQLSSKGKVLSQDLRPIIEAAPSIAGALQKLFGSIDSEQISAQLQKLGQNSSDFINQLTTELAKAPRVTGGLANQFENLGQTTTQSLAKVGDAISKAFNLPAVVGKVSDELEGLANSFASLPEGLQAGIVGLGGLAAATGPVLFSIGSLGAALPALKAGFKTLGVEAAADLAPILPVAAAVALAAYEIYTHWDEIRAYFTTGEGGRLFSDLATSVSRAIGDIRGALASLKGIGGDSFGELISASGLLKGSVKAVAETFTALANVVGGVVGGITKLLHKDFTGALEDAKRAVFGIVDPLAEVFGFTKNADASGLTKLGQAAQEAGQAVGGIGDQVAATAKKAGLLAELEARLKALKDAKPDLGSEAEIAASNQQIASLEAQIKKLNDLGKASTDMAKAYAEVQKSFREIGSESLALGDQFNYLQARQAADQSGIKKLLDAGYSPFSQAVQRLVGDLRNLNVTLGDNTQLSLRGLAALKDIKTPDFKVQTPAPIEPPKVLPMDLSGLSVDAEGILQGYDRIKAAQLAGSAQLSAAQENGLNRQREFNTNMEQLTSQLGASIGPELANIAGTLADAFGSIVAGTASAGDAFSAAFSGILSSISSFMADFGKQLITIGIGKLAFDTLFDGPQGGPLAIAAGLGLVALAGIAKAISSSASSSIKSIGSGGVGSVSTGVASTPRTYSPTTTSAAPANTTITHVVKLQLNGKDLLNQIQLATTQAGRVVKLP